jgi:hypothetical protein
MDFVGLYCILPTVRGRSLLFHGWVKMRLRWHDMDLDSQARCRQLIWEVVVLMET